MAPMPYGRVPIKIRLHMNTCWLTKSYDTHVIGTVPSDNRWTLDMCIYIYICARDYTTIRTCACITFLKFTVVQLHVKLSSASAVMRVAHSHSNIQVIPTGQHQQYKFALQIWLHLYVDSVSSSHIMRALIYRLEWCDHIIISCTCMAQPIQCIAPHACSPGSRNLLLGGGGGGGGRGSFTRGAAIICEAVSMGKGEAVGKFNEPIRHSHARILH